MAIYNEILAARYSRFMQRLFGMKGENAMKQLSGELIPVFPLFNGSENRILEGWNRIAAVVVVPAGGAGNASLARINMPAGYNSIAVIERIAVLSGVADNVTLAINTGASNNQANLSIAATQSSLDGRLVSAGGVVVSGKNNTAGGSPGTRIMSVGMPVSVHADFIVTDIGELPLSPSNSYDVTSANLNNGITVSFLWRERVLETSELSGT